MLIPPSRTGAKCTASSRAPKHTTHRPGPFFVKPHSGFTLIEVLVTVVVVSVGLLGLAGLQVNGLRANVSSEARSKATLMANDIIERMRANPLGVENNAYGNIAVDAASCAAPATLCGNTSSSTAVNCSANEMADFDAWAWGCGTAAAGVQKGGVSHQLPNGNASVVCNDNDPADALPCSPGSTHTVTINWSERSPSDNGAITPQTIEFVVIP